MFSIGQTRAFSRIHLILALGTWVLDYLIVLLVKTPIAIALCSVFMSILSVFVFTSYLSRYFKIKISNLVPFKDISVLMLHSIITVGITRFFYLLHFTRS